MIIDIMASKVFFLIDHFKDPFAGTEGQVYALIKGLMARNIEAQLAVFKPSEYILKQQFPCPVKVLDIKKMLSLKAIAALLKLGFYLKRNDFKLVHIYFNDASVIAPVILRCFGLKVVISRRDMGFWYTPMLAKILKFNAKFVNACICNSHAVKAKTMEVENLALAKMHVVYNGLPEYKISPDDVDKAETIKEFLPPSNKIIGIVANIRPIKRIQDLIYAAEKIAAQKKFDFKIAIVGGGDESELAALCKLLNITDKVIFLGAQKNVEKYLKNFDIAVLTSDSEGLSNSIIEYMAAGKPVVCSNVGGNNELIKHGLNGYLYPVGDIQQLSNYLIALLESADDRKAFGLNGQRQVIENFSMNNMINDTLKVYSQLGVS